MFGKGGKVRGHLVDGRKNAMKETEMWLQGRDRETQSNSSRTKIRKAVSWSLEEAMTQAFHPTFE